MTLNFFSIRQDTNVPWLPYMYFYESEKDFINTLITYEVQTRTLTPTLLIIWENDIIQCNHVSMSCCIGHRHVSDTKTHLIRGVSVLHSSEQKTYPEKRQDNTGEPLQKQVRKKPKMQSSTTYIVRTRSWTKSNKLKPSA